MGFPEQFIDDNRKENVCIRKSDKGRVSKCVICEKTILNNERLIRIKRNGLKSLSFSMCFDCVKYLNDLIKN